MPKAPEHQAPHSVTFTPHQVKNFLHTSGTQAAIYLLRQSALHMAMTLS